MKTTGILITIAAALLAFVFIIERKQPNTREARELKHPHLDVERAYSIEITRPEGNLVLEKVSGIWTLTAPISDRGRQAEIEEWLTALNEIEVLEFIDAGELETASVSPSELGLTAEDALSVTIKREEDSPLHFLVGATGAFGGSTYISFPENPAYPDVYLVKGELRNLAAAPIDQIRDATLFGFAFEDAARIALAGSPNEMTLARALPASPWHLEKPVISRADTARVTNLMQPLWQLAAQTVRSDTGAPPPGELLATLSVKPFPGTKGERTVVSIFGPPEGSPLDLLIVKLNTRPHAMLFAAREDLARLLETPPGELRDRHLARIPLRNVQHITFRSTTDPEFHLLRSEKDLQFWRLSRRGDMRQLESANIERIGRFLQGLKKSEASELINIDGEALSKYGLDAPAVDIHFIAFGVPEGFDAARMLTHPSGDNAAIFDLSVGKVLIEDFFGDEEIVYTRFNNETTISRVDPEFLALFPTQASRWKGQGLLGFNPIQLRSLRIEQPHSPPATLSYDFTQNKWALQDGENEFPVDPQKAQLLVDKLSTLTAHDWLASGADAYAALKSPDLTLTLTLEMPDETSGGLTEKEIAITFAPLPTPEKLEARDAKSTFHYGRLGASPDIFLIDSTEVEALGRSLAN
jgi:hypothetical protein